MKRSYALIIAIVFIGASLTNPASGAVKAGSACTKAGATSTFSGKKYTCVKTGKLLVWNKGVLISKPSKKIQNGLLDLAILPSYTLLYKTMGCKAFMGQCLQHLGRVRFNDYDTSNFYEKPYGHAGSTNLGIGAGVLYDNRHNVLNVRHGFFSELAFLYYGKQFGGKYEFSSVFTDIRWFHPIRKRNVLALHAVGQFSLGNPPFNQLALLGGESIMRGYYLGRFRDRNLLAAQAEYRMLPFSFAKRWGATVFAGTGLVYNSIPTIESDHLLLAAGAGLRFLLFRKKDVWVRLDLAFTREGQGVYIYIGEAF